MRRILVPTDFSPHADAALAHATAFAKSFDAELHLLNVQIPVGPTSALIDQYPGEEEARRALDDIRSGVDRVSRKIVRGTAAGPTILAYAEEHGIDLVIMGSHGRRGVPRLLLGSVAEEVVRGSLCPVLTVDRIPEGGAVRPDYRNILVPVDFSSSTNGQLEWAADLARRFGSTLDLVHVVDPPVVPDLLVPFGAFGLDLKRIAVHAFERLTELAATLGDDVTVTTEVLVGRAPTMIAERASEDVDLIVMSTHGHSGVDRVLMGSVAQGVLRRVECPVLVTPTEATTT